MAQRRSNRNRRKKGRFGALAKLLSFVVILAAIIMGCTVFFRVAQVEVEGNARYTAAEVIAAAEVSMGDNLFGLNRYNIAQKIMRGLPYISEVSVQRRLPDTLSIAVTECEAAACIETAGGWILFNSGGKVLETATETELPQVTGITPLETATGMPLAVGEEERAKFTSLVGLLTALEGRQLLEHIDSIDLSSDTRMTMEYDGRLTVRVPLKADFEYKAKALISALDYLEDGQSCIIDLTYDDGTHIIPK